MEFKVGETFIGKNHPPFILAELSGNHNQSLRRALQLVEAAAKAGAHGVKLQTYTAETMTLNLKTNDFVIRDPKSLWNGRSLYDLYGEASTPYEWHAPIFKRCKELGLEAFSTPFDPTAVDFLESLDVPAYKIASFENTDIPLIRKVASTGKPLFISSGMASKEELQEAVLAAKDAGAKNIVVLKCTSAYPAEPKDIHLSSIPEMKKALGVEVGLSDHTLGLAVPLASIPYGVCFIEKHFTLSREEGGVDSAFSLEPQELEQLVVESERAFHALGKVQWGPTANEKNSLQFRRSIYVVRPIKKGEKITSENIRIIRPGFGLAPKHFDEILGSTAKASLEVGTPLSFDLID